MNVVIFGCRKITIDMIDYIFKNHPEHTISGVVNHDFERDRVYDKMLVAEKCAELSIPTVRFEKNVDVGAIEKMNPDVIFSAYYRLILKAPVLNIPKLGCINIHPGYLPKDRGPAPSLWNILNGDEFAGTTIHYMVRSVDAGDIIDQKRVSINDMTGYELNRYLMNLGFKLFTDNFDLIMRKKNNRIPQNHDEATYTLHFAKHLRYLHWDDPNRVINQLRAFALPFDGALAYTKNCKVNMFAGRIMPRRNSFSAPGFFNVIDGGIEVQTCTLPVLISDYNVISGTLPQKGRFLSGPPLQEEIK
jgi:methionyl-tRNA formyltransferase